MWVHIVEPSYSSILASEKISWMESSVPSSCRLGDEIQPIFSIHRTFRELSFKNYPAGCQLCTIWIWAKSQKRELCRKWETAVVTIIFILSSLDRIVEWKFHVFVREIVEHAHGFFIFSHERVLRWEITRYIFAITCPMNLKICRFSSSCMLSLDDFPFSALSANPGTYRGFTLGLGKFLRMCLV